MRNHLQGSQQQLETLQYCWNARFPFEAHSIDSDDRFPTEQRCSLLVLWWDWHLECLWIGGRTTGQSIWIEEWCWQRQPESEPGKVSLEQHQRPALVHLEFTLRSHFDSIFFNSKSDQSWKMSQYNPYKDETTAEKIQKDNKDESFKWETERWENLLGKIDRIPPIRLLNNATEYFPELARWMKFFLSWRKRLLVWANLNQNGRIPTKIDVPRNALDLAKDGDASGQG